jgi:glutamate synthase (NADPH/NADH) small chain
VRGVKGEPVAIGRLERFVADWYRENVNAMPEKARAERHEGRGRRFRPLRPDLCERAGQEGLCRPIFEALHDRRRRAGLRHPGIPSAQGTSWQTRSKSCKAQGVEVMTDMVIGKVLSIDELFEMGFASGISSAPAPGLPMFMNIPGETLKGVYSANEYLTRINLMKAYLAESDTPILHSKTPRSSAAATSRWTPPAAPSAWAPRRSTSSIAAAKPRCPPDCEEQHHAKEEGIEFMTLTNPTEILGGEDGRACGMKCIKMELGEPDASGRRRPIPIAGSEFTLDVDMVIMALGTTPNPLLRSTTPASTPTRRAASSSTRTRCPPAKTSLPAATPSRARPPSSSPWAPARRPPLPSTRS